MAEIPKEQRCKRSDSKRWRCRLPVMEGKQYCEVHYQQGIRRQRRQPVPEHLKLRHTQNLPQKRIKQEDSALKERVTYDLEKGVVVYDLEEDVIRCDPEKEMTVSNREMKSDFEKSQRLHMIRKLLPVMTNMNTEKMIELDIEAKNTGIYHDGLQVPIVGCTRKKECSICKACLPDVHRSCDNCSFILCLVCCRDCHDGYLHASLETLKETTIIKRGGSTSISWRFHLDGHISCPPKNFGGCETGLLRLTSFYPFSLTKDLVERAKKLLCNFQLKNLNGLSDSSPCALCDENGEAGLYFSTKPEFKDNNLEHFMKHWGKGEPVVIRDACQNQPDLNWDFGYMLCAYLKKSAYGRGWQCGRPAAEGRTFCELHLKQSQLRQKRQPVPDHLKLERAKRTPIVPKPQENSDFGASDVSVRQVKRKVKKEPEDVSDVHRNKVVNLKFGTMVIAPASGSGSSEASPSMAVVKIGGSPTGRFRRRLRTKTSEPIPIVVKKHLPHISANVAEKKKTDSARFRKQSQSKNDEPVPTAEKEHLPNISANIVDKKKECSFCKACIPDVHRSCDFCSSILCLGCCHDHRDGYLHSSLENVKETKIIRSKSVKSTSSRLRLDGRISCPPKNLGGCERGLLRLTSFNPFSLTKDLEESAKKLLCTFQLKNLNGLSDSSPCPLCESSMYFSTQSEFKETNLEHFMQHWGKGKPVVIRDICQNQPNWDFGYILCTYLETCAASRSNTGTGSVKSTDDWCDIELTRRQTFSRGVTYENVWRECLKYKLRFSCDFLQDHFADHYGAMIQSLPFEEYMNPFMGFLNLGAYSPNQTKNPNLGSYVCVTYGGLDNPLNADLLTNLRVHAFDVVSILVHAAASPISEGSVNQVKTLMCNYSSQDHLQSSKKIAKRNNVEKMFASSSRLDDTRQSEVDLTSLRLEDTGDHKVVSVSSDSESESDDEYSSEVAYRCGTHWDIFRREDVPMLLEYLKKNSDKLTRSHGSSEMVVHPVFDEVFYLDDDHKARLKEEFNADVLSFEQKIGEAIIIPAGCPYQMKNVKWCVHVVYEFMSPESALESIKVSDEIRLLPVNHKAKGNMVQAINRMHAAIEEMRKAYVSQPE